MQEENILERQPIPGGNYLNVLELLRSFNFSFVSNNDNVKSVTRFYKELMALGKEGDVLTLSGANKKERLIFAQMAVALTLAGKHVDVIGDVTTEYFALLKRVFSREYMFLEDYLQKVADPVDLALSIRKNIAFACIRDGAIRRDEEGTDVRLQIYAVPFDRKRKVIAQKAVEAFSCNYSDLAVCPIYSMYDLSSTFTEARDNSMQLNDVISDFEMILSEAFPALADVTLNFTNLLLCEYQGVVYLAYVAQIERAYQYKMIPLSKGYSSFPSSMDVWQYDSLLDIRALADWEQLIGKLGSFVREDHCQFKVPRCVHGCTLNVLRVASDRYLEDCGYKFDEIGIWSVHTSQGRIGAQKMLLKYFIKEKLRERHYLTFWGGNHPAVSTRLLIDYKIWK